ncbi:ribosome assembly RNA-binding protein YhbY [Chloroflexia bacterium SDU3-3]|nr:ribosome assembly RNA-binding protein YhbY [Chloroflexia bacterium SDU3-3]
MQLTQKQRQYLRKTAHNLKPIVQIGKNGITDQTIAAIDQVLITHELIKVKFNDVQDEKQELSESLADRTGSALVYVIGNTVILYRESPDPDLRSIILPI